MLTLRIFSAHLVYPVEFFFYTQFGYPMELKYIERTLTDSSGSQRLTHINTIYGYWTML